MPVQSPGPAQTLGAAGPRPRTGGFVMLTPVLGLERGRREAPFRRGAGPANAFAGFLPQTSKFLKLAPVGRMWETNFGAQPCAVRVLVLALAAHRLAHPSARSSAWAMLPTTPRWPSMRTESSLCSCLHCSRRLRRRQHWSSRSLHHRSYLRRVARRARLRIGSGRCRSTLPWRPSCPLEIFLSYRDQPVQLCSRAAKVQGRARASAALRGW